MISESRGVQNVSCENREKDMTTNYILSPNDEIPPIQILLAYQVHFQVREFFADLEVGEDWRFETGDDIRQGRRETQQTRAPLVPVGRNTPYVTNRKWALASKDCKIYNHNLADGQFEIDSHVPAGRMEKKPV